MILKKVALPLGVDGKSYWEAMILGITNDKFCSLRANFNQELFEQFQGNFIHYKHGNGSVLLMR
jgi:hypothetical protein